MVSLYICQPPAFRKIKFFLLKALSRSDYSKLLAGFALEFYKTLIVASTGRIVLRLKGQFEILTF